MLALKVAIELRLPVWRNSLPQKKNSGGEFYDEIKSSGASLSHRKSVAGANYFSPPLK